MEQFYLVSEKGILEPWHRWLQWVENVGLERKLEESVLSVCEGRNGRVSVYKFVPNSKNSETVTKTEYISIFMGKNNKTRVTSDSFQWF